MRHFRSRRLLFTLASTLVMMTAAGGPPALADERPTRVQCRFDFIGYFDVPISLETTTSDVGTRAPGTISCIGTWEGHPVDATGSLMYVGRSTAQNCALSVVESVITVRMPSLATGGRLRFDNLTVRPGVPVVSTGGDEELRFAAVSNSERFDDEDCYRVPIERIRIFGDVLVTDVV